MSAVLPVSKLRPVPVGRWEKHSQRLSGKHTHTSHRGMSGSLVCTTSVHTACHFSMQFKKPVCIIRERRVLLGTIPLNVTTTHTIHIDNTGESHAYYKVSEDLTSY